MLGKKLTIEQEAELVELLQMGIETDGGHHKQWCLVQVAKILGVPFVTDDEGIAP